MPMKANALYSLIAVLFLSACGGYQSYMEVEALQEAQAVGSPFTQQLTAEYREYSSNEQNGLFDYADALHFARKGLAAAKGEAVLPEPISDWDIDSTHLDPLDDARNRLMGVLEFGAREQMPVKAAVAQARFDCWIEKQEENRPADEINACKSEFMSLLEEMEATIQVPAPAPIESEPVAVVAPAPAVEMIAVDPQEPLPVENAIYLVFFDFDKSKITVGAQDVVNAVSDEIRSRSLNSVVITGHTDSSGPRAYNMRLSQRRANAVRDALIERGVPPTLIRTANEGELDLLVPTADGVREPANRRATITFE